MQIKEDKMGGDEECIENFGWEPEGKMPLWISGPRWEDNIKRIVKK
jgi:hypothetical protein